ncbi:MAG: ABC transporter substrate-binding protein [Planctomycetota bacterium]
MRRAIAVLVVACLALLGCRHRIVPTPAPRVKVGVLLPLSGPLGSYGKACEEGIRLWAETNPRVDLIWEDDRGEAAASAEAFRRLDRAGASVVIGPVTSTCAFAVAPLADEARLPIVSPSASHFDVTRGHPYVSRVCFVDPMQGSALAIFARENLGVSRIAALLQKDEPYTKSLSEAFRQAFHHLGGVVVLVEEYEAGATDFGPILSRVKDSGAEALFAPGFVHEVGVLMKQARLAVPGLRILGGDGWDSPELFAEAGPAAEGHFYTSQFAPTDKDEVVARFVSSYRTRYGRDPGMFAALGYDAAERVSLCLADGTREGITKTLSSTSTFRGVTGSMTFDADRNPMKPVVILRTLADRAVFETRVTFGPR